MKSTISHEEDVCCCLYRDSHIPERIPKNLTQERPTDLVFWLLKCCNQQAFNVAFKDTLVRLRL